MPPKKKKPPTANLKKEQAKSKTKDKGKTKGKSKSKSKGKLNAPLSLPEEEKVILPAADFEISARPAPCETKTFATTRGVIDSGAQPVGMVYLTQFHSAPSEGIDLRPELRKALAFKKSFGMNQDDPYDVSKLLHIGKGKRDVEEVQDHYKVLGIGSIGWRATTDDIEKGYKSAVIRWHPDRNLSLNGDDSMIHRVNRAYTVLTDTEKRREFDSIYDCDDRLPSGSALEKDFFEVFRPVFERNARWSMKQPVPDLGTMDSPAEDVDAFYDFWNTFSSWRVFNHNDEHSETDIRCADRDNRRAFLRANERARKKAKNEENVRIGKLVDLAYKVDPRIIARRNAAKAAKEAEEQAKADAARKEAEAAAAAAAAEMKKEEALAAEKQKEYEEGKNAFKERKAAEKKARKRFRKCFEGEDALKADSLAQVLSVEELTKLCDMYDNDDQKDAALKDFHGRQA